MRKRNLERIFFSKSKRKKTQNNLFQKLIKQLFLIVLNIKKKQLVTPSLFQAPYLAKMKEGGKYQLTQRSK